MLKFKAKFYGSLKYKVQGYFSRLIIDLMKPTIFLNFKDKCYGYCWSINFTDNI
jgi:hypothetical protein